MNEYKVGQKYVVDKIGDARKGNIIEITGVHRFSCSYKTIKGTDEQAGFDYGSSFSNWLKPYQVMQSKYKVGQRYIIDNKEWQEHGTIIEITNVNEKHCSYKTIKGKCYSFPFFELNSSLERSLKPYNPPQTVVVYSDGLITKALLKDGKTTLKSSQAKCNPSDTYDFQIGAKLALERLFEDKPEFDWDGVRNGKFVVNCKTGKMAFAFLQNLAKRYPTLKWGSDELLLSKTLWETHKDKTCYLCGICGLQYTSVGRFMRSDYKIVEYKGE